MDISTNTAAAIASKPEATSAPEGADRGLSMAAVSQEIEQRGQGPNHNLSGQVLKQWLGHLRSNCNIGRSVNVNHLAHQK
eukprot:10478622-Heterocapsa_arctica.AAC.1